MLKTKLNYHFLKQGKYMNMTYTQQGIVYTQ